MSTIGKKQETKPETGEFPILFAINVNLHGEPFDGLSQYDRIIIHERLRNKKQALTKAKRKIPKSASGDRSSTRDPSVRQED